jgi:hypothetical protein
MVFLHGDDAIVLTSANPGPSKGKKSAVIQGRINMAWLEIRGPY